jgi:hypothetical protein
VGHLDEALPDAAQVANFCGATHRRMVAGLKETSINQSAILGNALSLVVKAINYSGAV